MPRRADIFAAQIALPILFNRAGTPYLVQTPTGVLYAVFADSASDVSFSKSLDRGVTWGASVLVFTGTTSNLSVWYDRWSGIAAGLIHLAYTDTTAHDTFYRTIDTESSDALSTQTVIFAGVSAANGAHLSIARARGGNVYCKTCIDAGAEGGFFRLPNANVPNGAWDVARTVDEVLATGDQMILLPGWNADNQDMTAIFWDGSADEISRKLYDDSGNAWAETSIATTMVDQLATTAFPHFAAAVDITNSQFLLVAWSAVDTLNADLRMWKITDTTITEMTNVVLNSTDDQGLCAISLDLQTGWYRVFYGGKSDGSETFPSAINVYCKCSMDGGTTWGSESLVSSLGVKDTEWMCTVPRLVLGPSIVAFSDAGTGNSDPLRVSVDHTTPRAVALAGIM